MKLPTVSVVLPAYNAASFIRSTLESVFNQTYQDYELIVVDDGSSDDTAAVAQALLNRHPGNIQLVRHQQPGGPGNPGDKDRGS